MPIYKIGNESFEVASPAEAAFIASKMGGVPFSEMTAPKIGNIAPVKEGAEDPAGTSRYEGGTPSGRKARVTVSTVPGSLREATPEEMSDRRVMGSEGFGTVSLGQALMPRTAEVMQQMNDDKASNYQTPGAEVDIRKPEYNQRFAAIENAPRLGWNAFKDVASLPMRALSTHPDLVPLEYASRGPLHQMAMTQAEGLPGIARGPEMVPMMASGMAPETALGRALASMATAQAFPSLNRATDYDESTSAMPTGRELAINAATSFLPEALPYAREAAPGIAKEANRLFLSQVKALPGKNRRQVWESLREWATPENIKETLPGTTTLPEVAQSFYRGMDRRKDQVMPLYDAMEQAGARVQIQPSLDEALEEVAKLRPSSATIGERDAALDYLYARALQPTPEDYKSVYRFSRSGQAGPTFVPSVVTEFTPREAVKFKGDMYRAIDWGDPAGATAKEAAFTGAAANLRRQLEQLDETGTLAQKNREWGEWLGAEEAMKRMESRTANANAPHFWQLPKRYKTEPQTVARLYSLADALGSIPAYTYGRPAASMGRTVINESER